MSTRIAPTQIQNLQQIEATVTGPDGATRLITVTGQFDTNVYWPPGSQQKETFTVLVGPVLTRRQFNQAIATASIAKASLQLQPTQGQFNWQILDSDADWDDESGQVELRIEVAVFSSGAGNNAQIGGLAFNATILCA
ncbi:MAG: hypothetical protein ABI556_13420 [Gemmatimonadales bacterium]